MLSLVVSNYVQRWALRSNCSSNACVSEAGESRIEPPPSPAVLWMVNVRKRKPRWKKNLKGKNGIYLTANVQNIYNLIGCEEYNIGRIVLLHCIKSVRFCCFSGPYFPEIGLNTERYSVSLGIQSEFERIWTRKTLNTGTFHAFLVSMLYSLIKY